ncbi:MAG: flagellar export chaperone FlgN, partial [Phycisphaerales bacterium]|nr:flagellar export chaperone FlgN [Phycisphaerales bacterium]
LLDALEAHHAEQLGLLDEHLLAIRRADQAMLAICVQRQQTAALRLSELEQVRAQLVGEIVGRASAAKSLAAPVTLSALAHRAGPDAAPRLLAQASRLRTLVAECLDKQVIIAQASTSLLGHVQSLVRQIARNLSDTGTYARHHTTAAPAHSIRAVDVLS